MSTVPLISGGKRKPPKTPSPPNVIRGEEHLTLQDGDALFDASSSDSIKAWGEAEFSSDIGSPSGCSTNSDTFYLRTPGFEHHGHAFQSVTGLLAPIDPVSDGVRLKVKDAKPSSRPGSRPGSGKKSDQSKSKTSSDVNVKLFRTNSTDDVLSTSKQPNEKSYSSASKVSCKKKKANSSTDKLICVNDIGCLKDPAVPKIKAKKEPLPMKLRALPLSFWQQPNQASEFSPAQCAVPLLPPLFKADSHNEVTDIRPVTPENKTSDYNQSFGRAPDGSASSTRSHVTEAGTDPSSSGLKSSSRVIKISNTDLLMKLFDGLEEQKPCIVRRGRPKKETPVLHRKVTRGEDPCFGSTATEGLLPLLSGMPENRASALVGASGSGPVFKPNNLTSISVNRDGSQTVTILSVKDGDNNVVSLPALSLENNYSQMLSELVVKL